MDNNTSNIALLKNIINDQHTNVGYDGRRVRFNYRNTQKDEIELVFNTLSIPHEFHLNLECEIRIDKPLIDGSLILFYDELDFLKRGKSFFENFNNNHYVVLKNEPEALQKVPNESFSIKNRLFFNYFYYLNILSFLEKQEQFISVNFRADLQFVIFSSEKGPFHIGYNLHEPRVKNLEDLSLVYRNIELEFNKIDFVQFFKLAVINTIHEYSISERFFYLVQSLRVISSIAQRDHYIYIKNFNFEKIKSKFKEERNKYFESLEKSIDSISKQVTSFPLTFAASIFAGYQVKDKPVVLILVFIAYALYTVIAWRILRLTSYNTESIKKDVTIEEEKIKTAFDLLYTDFKDDFKKIHDKINMIMNLIGILKIVLIGLLISFLVFSLSQFISSNQRYHRWK